MKKVLFAVAFASIATAASAVTFDNSASTTPATATIIAGGGGDYTSLAAASAAFSGVSGGINRPWILEIGSDLNETAFSYFGNSFGADGSLTIKPNASLPAGQPVVSFADATAPAGIFGHVVFGVKDGLAVSVANANHFASTGKYVIDGAKTGTSRDMSWIVPGASAVNNTIRIFGETNGVVIKNLKMTINDTGGSYASIGLGGGVVAGFAGGDNVTPDDCTIQNCEFTANGTGANGFAIQTTLAANGTIPSAAAVINGLTVTGCDLTVKQRGIFMNGVGNASITDNRITVANSATSTATNAIFHFSSNAIAAPFTQVYDRNVIEVSSTATAAGTAAGCVGIFVDTGAVGGTYTITNNIVKGPGLTNATAIDTLCRFVSLANATATITFEHNSILVPTNAASGATAGRFGAIVFPVALTTGTALIKNNIIVNQDTEASSLTAAIYAPATTGITSANNNIVAARAIGRIGTTDYLTIGDWTTSSTIDTTSQSVDPTATTPAWDANLHFASTPPTIAVVASSSTLTDIDGQARPATGAFPGADQPPASSINDWTMF